MTVCRSAPDLGSGPTGQSAIKSAESLASSNVGRGMCHSASARPGRTAQGEGRCSRKQEHFGASPMVNRTSVPEPPICMASDRRPHSKRVRPSWIICAYAYRDSDLVCACVGALRAFGDHCERCCHLGGEVCAIAGRRTRSRHRHRVQAGKAQVRAARVRPAGMQRATSQRSPTVCVRRGDAGSPSGCGAATPASSRPHGAQLRHGDRAVCDSSDVAAVLADSAGVAALFVGGNLLAAVPASMAARIAPAATLRTEWPGYDHRMSDLPMPRSRGQ
jgi:hypothetical protein